MFIFMFMNEFRHVLSLIDNFQEMDMDLSIRTDIML